MPAKFSSPMTAGVEVTASNNALVQLESARRSQPSAATVQVESLPAEPDGAKDCADVSLGARGHDRGAFYFSGLICLRNGAHRIPTPGPGEIDRWGEWFKNAHEATAARLSRQAPIIRNKQRWLR